MTGFEPANGGVTIHCLTTWLHPPVFLRCGADSGNRTRTSCLEGKGTTTMQYPLKSIIKIFKKKKQILIFFTILLNYFSQIVILRKII